MSRFVALYRMPADPDAFEAAYRSTHVPLVARTPGLIRVEISKVRRTVLGEPLLLLATMHFTDPAAVKAAMASAEWAEAGRNLAEIGGIELATMVTLDDPEVIEADGATSR